MSTEAMDPATRQWKARQRRQRQRIVGSIVYPALSGLGGLVIWQAVVRLFKIPSYLLPAPTDVAAALFGYWDMLIGQLGFTALAAATGFAIALVLGIAAAGAITASRTVNRMLYPWLVVSHAVPKVVVAPLFIVWLGFGLKSEIIFVVIFTFFPIVVNTVTGLKSADPDLLLLVRSMEAKPLKILWKVRIPGALPHIFAGVKISATLAPVGAVIGEFVASNQGLGHMLLQAVGNLETDIAFAAVFLISIFGIAIWYLAELAERLAIPWHASQRETVAGK